MPHLEDPGLVCVPAGAQGVGDNGGGYQLGAEQILQVQQGQGADARHDLGAVDEGDALLSGQVQWLETRIAQGLGARDDLPLVVQGLALTHYHQRDIGQGRQVARGPQGASGSHHGGDAPV